MTLGSGGGSPKTIQTINYTISSGNEVFYTCPVDTMTFFKPLLMVTSGGSISVGQFWIYIRNINPVTAAPIDTLYDFGTNGGLPSPILVGAGAVGGGGISGDISRMKNVGTVIFPSIAGSGVDDSKAFGSPDLLIYPGEALKLGSGPAGGRLKYSIVEYGIAS